MLDNKLQPFRSVLLENAVTIHMEGCTVAVASVVAVLLLVQLRLLSSKDIGWEEAPMARVVPKEYTLMSAVGQECQLSLAPL